MAADRAEDDENGRVEVDDRTDGANSRGGTRQGESRGDLDEDAMAFIAAVGKTLKGREQRDVGATPEGQTSSRPRRPARLGSASRPAVWGSLSI